MKERSESKSKVNSCKTGKISHLSSIYSKKLSTLKPSFELSCASGSSCQQHSQDKNSNPIKDFNQRCQAKEKDKAIKLEIAAIEQHMHTKNQCTFYPKLNDSDFKFTRSFAERQINTVMRKDCSVEKHKYQQNVQEKTQVTFRPKILKVSHNLQNYIPIQQRQPNKKESETSDTQPKSRNTLSQSVSSYNSLYQDAVRRATNKTISNNYFTNSLSNSVLVDSNTNRIYYDKLKSSIDSIILAHTSNDTQIKSEQFTSIAMKLGCKNAQSLWNLSLCQNICYPKNLMLLLYIIFGITKIDSGWNSNCTAKQNGIGL